MKNPFPLPAALALVLALALGVSSAAAQQLELPRPSPLSKVSQVVGVTEIALEYSSPAVKGRKIWGGLLPYGELWRTGANQATRISFSTDVTVGDKAVPAGTYAIFTIPGKDAWTFILNKNPNQGGTGNYKKELDQLRLQLHPRPSAHRERLTFLFLDATDNGATLQFEWEKLALPVSIKVNTDALVQARIKTMDENSWRPYNGAARYLLEGKKDYDQALRLVDRSLLLKEDWLNLWTKAQLLQARGRVKEACLFAEKARALGDKADAFFFADDVKKALADWKCAAK